MKSFEERMARLEEINENLRRGNLPLNDAMEHFEEGMKLARGLEKELSKIERKIEILIDPPESPEEKGTEEKPHLELFDENS